jgi:hypothetical protein
MRLTFCVACGSAEDLQHHHLVTRAEGGGDDPSNLIALCYGCHLKLHTRRMNARGVKLGGLYAKGIKNREEARDRAEALRPVLAELSGMSARAIAAELNQRGPWYAATVIRVQRRLKGERS